MNRRGYLLVAIGAAMSAAGAGGGSCVENVVMSQDAATGKVSVSYDISEDRIVTVDFLTNGVPVGSVNQRNLSGDVNRLVTGGTGHEFAWIPPPLLADSSASFAAGAVSVLVTAWTEGTPPDYTVFDLIDGSRAYYVDEDSLPLGIESDVYRTTKLVMRRIPAAGVVWRIGSPEGENGRNANETRHEVLLTNDYYMAVFEFTQGQLEAVYGGRTVWIAPNSYAPHFGGARYAVRPVENIRCQAIGYVLSDYLRTRCGCGAEMRLPTAAEWEYACRAGTETALPNGKDTAVVSDTTEDPNITEIARCKYNAYPGGQTPAADCDPAEGGTARVGSYPANRWGLYDVIGNVMELCCDMFTTYPTTREIAPNAPLSEDTSSYNVRGGGWTSTGNQARSAARCAYNQYVSANYLGYRFSLQIHAPAADADVAPGGSTEAYVLRRGGSDDSPAADVDTRCLTKCLSDAIAFLSTPVTGILLFLK